MTGSCIDESVQIHKLVNSLDEVHFLRTVSFRIQVEDVRRGACYYFQEILKARVVPVNSLERCC